MDFGDNISFIETESQSTVPTQTVTPPNNEGVIGKQPETVYVPTHAGASTNESNGENFYVEDVTSAVVQPLERIETNQIAIIKALTTLQSQFDFVMKCLPAAESSSKIVEQKSEDSQYIHQKISSREEIDSFELKLKDAGHFSHVKNFWTLQMGTDVGTGTFLNFSIFILCFFLCGSN